MVAARVFKFIIVGIMFMVFESPKSGSDVKMKTPDGFLKVVLDGCIKNVN